MFLLRPGGWVILLSLMGGFLLDGLPLPLWLERLSPDWLALVLIYWSMALPRRVGIGTGWVAGLFVDTVRGSLLGQHALVYAVLCFLAVKSHRQVRVFPLWQQAITVTLFLLSGRLLLFWIDAMTGYPPRGAWFLAPLASTLVLWPLVFVLLRDLRRYFNIS